jgi:hypothetical protein
LIIQVGFKGGLLMSAERVALKGSEYCLNGIRDKLIADTVTLRLFKNNYTPTQLDVLADYVECDFGGYAPVVFNDWAALVILGTFASISAPTKTFTASGSSANSVYGYYVTDVTGLILLWAQRDDLAPVAIANLGDQYFVTPVLTTRSLYP